ncbi:hypothetical protein MKW94_005198 [Papaver nudicaule]|uniref:Uncharacterized protein n=1 Tax=Papaver nudicaule TaxID=74823 RepID=A0AA41VJF1_PAPNU|nr:hypothetical protein [Papaver nudicaule]
MSDSDEELGVEDLPVDVKENGKAAKPDAASAAKKVKVVDPKADEVDSDESESEDSDSDEDEEMGEDDSDEADSSDEEEQTPTPKGKKRAAEVANKKPTPGDKKAKLETPQKSGADGKKADGKKGGAVQPGTPYPKGGKTPASGGNKNKSPKSGAFGTDSALQAHSKAKHNK